MRATPLVLAALVAAALAGCVDNPQESEEEGITRGIVVSVPDDAVRVHVSLTVTSTDAPRVQVVLEEEDYTDITEDSFVVSNGTASRTLTVEGNGRLVLAVLMVVTRGEAVAEITVHSEQPDGQMLFLRNAALDFRDAPPAQ